MSDELTPKQIAEEANAFIDSPFGKHFINQLQIKYNSLHHDAEHVDLSAEQKAYRVERAAGVKMAIDYLFMRRQRVESGEFDEKKKAGSST